MTTVSQQYHHITDSDLGGSGNDSFIHLRSYHPSWPRAQAFLASDCFFVQTSTIHTSVE